MAGRASSKAEVAQVTGLLGYTEQQRTGENTMKVYARHGIDLNTIAELRPTSSIRQSACSPHRITGRMGRQRTAPG